MALIVLIAAFAMLSLLGVAAILMGRTGQARLAGLDKRLTRIAIDRDRYTLARASVPLADRVMAALPKFLMTRLARADIEAKPTIILGIVIFYFGAVIGGLMMGGTMVAVAIGTILLGLCLLVLEAIAARRLDDFVDALPSYFDRVRQLVATGNTLQQALERANDNAPPAINRFVDPVIGRLRHGAPVTESVTLMARRLDVAELSMFATAVETNMRYGGRLSDVMENLVNLLRDRSRVGRELKAATSETRTSTMILIALPLLVALLIIAINPDYVSFFITDPMGRTMLTVAGMMEIAGLIIARRLSSVNY